MHNDHQSLWFKRIIVVILGLLGILVFVGGLSISSSVFVNDELGMIVIIVGLLIFLELVGYGHPQNQISLKIQQNSKPRPPLK